MKNRISAWIVLGLITLMAGLGLAITNQVTKGPIENQAIAAQELAKKQVMPEADKFEVIELGEGSSIQELSAALKGNDESGYEIIGYVGKTAGKGYGGEVEVIAGVKEDGTLTGVYVGGASFAETPGLGAKARDAAFTNQFTGKTSPVRLGDPSQANAVEAITAATITSNSVLGSVNNIARQVKNYLNPEADQPAVAEGTSYAGEAQGFIGPVYVVVTVKDDGTISGLKIGDDRFNESENYGANALLPEFASQFTGKTLPVALEDIDAISGSTFTTKAVLDAINTAYENKNVVAGLPVYSGEAVGFAGAVYVEFTLNPDNTIAVLKIGDDRFNETDNFGANALLPEFSGQFTGKSLPITVDDIEAISGSTYTTQAVIDAINAAYAAGATNAGGSQVPEGDVYAGEAVGYSGKNNPVYVEVTIKEDGTITDLKIGDERFNETDNFGANALLPEFTSQFVGKSLPVAMADIEAISGATITTEAVLNAINTAYENKNIIREGAEAVVEEPAETQADEPVELVVPEGALTASAEGFAGPVAVALTFDEVGKITFIKIGDQNFAETANFGLKALEEGFYSQFIGKLPPLMIKEAGQEASESTIDGITGATVTTKAVLSAVNQLHESAFHVEAPVEEPQEDKPIVVTGDEFTVTKEGFMGPVTVKVTFNQDGSIAKLHVGDESFVETKGYGALILEEKYTQEYAGKLPPLVIRQAGEESTPSNVNKLLSPDTYTSATITSQAVVDAINEAYEAFKAQQENAPITKQGFMGPISVKTSFNEDGTIQAVVIVAEGFEETAGYGALALEDGFTDRFLGKQAPLKIREAGEADAPGLVDNLVNPDTNTQASITLQAIIDAINEAFENRP